MGQTQSNKMASADVIKFAMGGFGVMAITTMTMNYLTFFFTDIFGISSFVVAGLMLVARVIDAVTDPMMGIISDHTRTKFGQYRPYLMFATPILGLIVFLLFSAPNLSTTMKVVYVYIVYIGYSLASTAVVVPYSAVVPIISKNSLQRTLMVTYKSIMSQTGKFVVTVFTIPLVNLFGGGKQGWACYAALMAVFITVSFWLSAWGCKPYDTKEKIEVPKKKTHVWQELPLLFKNKPLLMLITAYSTDMIANATLGSVNMYYFKYVLHREDLVAAVGLAMTITGFVSIPMMPVFIKKFGKKATYWGFSLLSIIPLAIMWFRPDASALFICVFMGIFGLFSNIPSNLGWILLPDCTDYAEWKFGMQGSGLTTSAFMFVNKFGSAFGAFISSFLLGVVGFVANQEQAQAVIAMILFLRFGVPILGYIASIISMHFYSLTDDRCAEIRADLDKRASQK